jgi:cytochrome P450
MEARIAFEEIVWRWRRIELAGEPVAQPSLLVRGIERLPLAFAP